MVMVSGPKRYLKGLYEFYLKAQARGGATFYSGKMTLKVKCGPLSTYLTESVYDATQEHEVGSIHGFYFNNFTSFADCPVFTYTIVDAAAALPSSYSILTADFQNAANLSIIS